MMMQELLPLGDMEKGERSKGLVSWLLAVDSANTQLGENGFQEVLQSFLCALWRHVPDMYFHGGTRPVVEVAQGPPVTLPARCTQIDVGSIWSRQAEFVA